MDVIKVCHSSSLHLILSKTPKVQIIEQPFFFLQPSVSKLKAWSIISREKDTLYFLLCNGRRT